MRKFFYKIYLWQTTFGFNILQFIQALKWFPNYIRSYFKINNELKLKNNPFKISELHPCFPSFNEESGIAKGHYFHMDLYVAQKIYNTNPLNHVDIGSRIDGFIAHLLVFRNVEVFDIRKLDSKISNLQFKQVDLMNDNFSLVNYCDSISCLHTIEHFGLGRYGDKLDIDGHLKGLNNITKCLKSGGVFYFATPIGKQRIVFNAHRVFGLEYLIEILKNDYDIRDFSYVDDNGDLIINPKLDDSNIKSSFNLSYGCGIFELIKK